MEMCLEMEDLLGNLPTKWSFDAQFFKNICSQQRWQWNDAIHWHNCTVHAPLWIHFVGIKTGRIMMNHPFINMDWVGIRLQFNDFYALIWVHIETSCQKYLRSWKDSSYYFLFNHYDKNVLCEIFSKSNNFRVSAYLQALFLTPMCTFNLITLNVLNAKYV